MVPPATLQRLALVLGGSVVLGLVCMWLNSKRKPGRGGRGTPRGSGTPGGGVTPGGGGPPVSSETPDASTSPSQHQDTDQDDSHNDPGNASSLDRAEAAKERGNVHFKAGRYKQALRYYTEAIALCPTERHAELAVFYQNRAATYEYLKQWAEAIQDCSQAVELNPRYVKALFRRAKALEKLGRKQECLEDVMAVCLLELCKNKQSMNFGMMVLQLLATEKAASKREPALSSPFLIKTYFGSFTDDIISQKKENEDESAGANESSPYLTAKRYMEEEEYDKVIGECTKEIDSGGKYTAEALLLRATFYFLSIDSTSAQSDFDRVINMRDANMKLRANALIKRGSIYLNKGDKKHATQYFDKAVKTDPCNPDVYQYRGQCYLHLDRMDDAIRDFEQCILLRPDYDRAHSLKCYALYKKAFIEDRAQVQAALDGFEDISRRFPKCAELYNLYAIALFEHKLYGKADEMYDKCIALEPDNASTYVAKACLQLKWKGNAVTYEELIRKAIEVDSTCEFACDYMGKIELQRGNFDKAIAMFSKAIKFAKNEDQLVGLYYFYDLAKGQKEVSRKYGLRSQSPYDFFHLCQT